MIKIWTDNIEKIKKEIKNRVKIMNKRILSVYVVIRGKKYEV